MDGIKGYISIREASCRWGVSERRVNQYCAKGVFPAHPVSEVNIMPKPKWNLNTIYISERLQESLGPISRCAMTTVVAAHGLRKDYGG